MSDASIVVDFGPALAAAANMLLVALTPLAICVATRLAQKFGLQISQAQLDTALGQGVEFARGMLIQKIGHADFAKVETRDAAVGWALQHINSAAPGALKSLGISDSLLQSIVLGQLAKLDPTIVTSPASEAAEIAPAIPPQPKQEQ